MMLFIKRHISKIVLFVVILVVAVIFFVQKLTNKEFQKVKNVKNEDREEMLDTAKDVVLRAANSLEQHSSEELKTPDSQKNINQSANIKKPSNPKNVIYEKPSNEVYLAQ